MPLRSVVSFVLIALLAACSSQPSKVPEVDAPPMEPSQAPQSKSLNQLTGALAGVPAGSEVELALLEIDRDGQPDRLLSNVVLNGTGGTLPFVLQFNPDSFPKNQRVELRGRVTLEGQLIMLMLPRQIHTSASQTVGVMQLVPAP